MEVAGWAVDMTHTSLWLADFRCTVTLTGSRPTWGYLISCSEHKQVCKLKTGWYRGTVREFDGLWVE